jgi:serine/threonine protein kinase
LFSKTACTSGGVRTFYKKVIMSAAVDLQPAEKFAERYVVERLLGEGDRKRTYLARDMKVDRLVALSLVKARECSV